MTNSFQLLGPELLKDTGKLKEIDHWLNVMDRPQGWHYDLDIIWLLQELEKAGIKKGDTVMDAGAGLGVTQFILAALGYNVISLDFSQRVLPVLAEGIFDIHAAEKDTLNYKHDYMGFVDYGTGVVASAQKPGFFSKVINAFFKKGPGNIVSILKNNARKQNNKQCHAEELTADHSKFGTIKFVRAAFHDIPLADMSVDALVSVSAIEHADKKLMKENIAEMKRVVKTGGPLLITTSAAASSEDSFHEKTKGLCFSENSLIQMSSATTPQEFNYTKIEQALLETKEWVSRIDAYYAEDPASEFYKKKMKKLPYLAVGVKIIK